MDIIFRFRNNTFRSKYQLFSCIIVFVGVENNPEIAKQTVAIDVDSIPTFYFQLSFTLTSWYVKKVETL